MRSITPAWPRQYQGVRTWPGGSARRTRTRAPGAKRAATTSIAPIFGLYFSHFPAQLVDADDAALDQGLGDGVHPTLVIAHALVGVRPQALDVAAQLIHLEQLPLLVGEQHHQRVDALLPQFVLVLVGHALAGGQSAHVVMAAHICLLR